MCRDCRKGGYPSGLTLRRRGADLPDKGGHGVKVQIAIGPNAEASAKRLRCARFSRSRPAVRLSPLRRFAQPDCGGRRIMTQFLPQGGYGFPLAGDVAALDDKSTATTGGRDGQISGAFGFETAAGVKKSRPRISVQGTRRPRNGRGGGHGLSLRRAFVLSRWKLVTRL